MPPKANPKPAAKTSAPAKQAAKSGKATSQPAGKAPAQAAGKSAKGQTIGKVASGAKAANPSNGIYIKGLTTEDVDAVKAIFSTVGTVASARVRRRRFAQVFFETAASVKKACDQFNNKDFKGKQLSVVAAKTGPRLDRRVNTKVVVVRPVFRQNATRNQVRDLFRACGKIAKLRTYRQNYAVVYFDSAAAASKAIKDKDGSTFKDKALRVKPSVRSLEADKAAEKKRQIRIAIKKFKSAQKKKAAV